MSLDTVIAGANAVLKTQQGIVRVHENAPESLKQLPATTLFAEKGSFDWPRKPNERRAEHNLILTLYVSRGGDLSSADKSLKPWVETMVDLFDGNITLQGNAFTAGVVDYSYGHVEYGGVQYLGVTFTLRAIEIKQMNYHG